MFNPKIIKVGDHIRYRGCFGRGPVQSAIITSIELTDQPRQKDGMPVDAVCAEYVKQNRVLFSLDNGHWCYSEQVAAISYKVKP